MTPQPVGNGETGAGEGSDPRQADAAPVDVVKLADRVYQFMLAEARLARARGQRVQRRPGR